MRSRPDLSAAALGSLERQTLGSVPGPVGRATMTRSPASRFGIVEDGDLAGDDAASHVPQLEWLLTRLSDGALLHDPHRSTVPGLPRRRAVSALDVPALERPVRGPVEHRAVDPET